MNKTVLFFSKLGKVSVLSYLALGLVSCFNDDLDVLNKDISTEVKVFGDGLSLPVGSLSRIYLKDYLEIDGELSELGEEGGLTSIDGTYAYVMSDQFSETVSLLDEALTISEISDTQNFDVSSAELTLGDLSIPNSQEKISISDEAIEVMSFSMGQDANQSITVGGLSYLSGVTTLVENVPVFGSADTSNDINVSISFDYDASEVAELKSLDKIIFHDPANSAVSKLVSIKLDASSLKDLFSSEFVLQYPSITIKFGDDFDITAGDWSSFSGAIALNGNTITITNFTTISSELEIPFYINSYNLDGSKEIDINENIAVSIKSPLISGTMKGSTVSSLAIDLAFDIDLGIDLEVTSAEIATDIAMDLSQSISVDALPAMAEDVEKITFTNSSLVLKVTPLDLSALSSLTMDDNIYLTFDEKVKFGNFTPALTESLNGNVLTIPTSMLLKSSNVATITLPIDALNFTGANALNEGQTSLDLDVAITTSGTDNTKLTLDAGELKLSQYNSLLAGKELSFDVSGNLTVDKVETGEMYIDVAENGSNSIALNIEEDGIPKELTKLYGAEISGDNIMLSIVLNGIDTGNEAISFSDFELTMPKFIKFAQASASNDNAFIGQDNKITLGSSNKFTKNGTTHTFDIELEISGLDVTDPSYEDLLSPTIGDEDSQTLSLNEEIAYSGNVVIPAGTSMDLSDSNISGKFSYTVPEMILSSVTADLDLGIDPVNEEIELDLSDEMDDITAKLTLSDPYVELNITNPVDVPIEVSNFKFVLSYDGKEDKTINVSDFTLSGGDIVLSVKEKQVEQDVQNIVVSGLATLLSDGIPDKIAITMEAGISDSDGKGHTIDLSELIGEKNIDFNYNVVLPIAFKDLDVNFSTTIEDMGESMAELSDVAAHIKLNIVSSSTLPIELKIDQIDFRDKDGILLNISDVVKDGSNTLGGSSDGVTAKTTTLNLNLDTSDADFSKIESIDLVIIASSDTSNDVELKLDQYLDLRIKAYLPEGLSIDFDELDADEE